MCAGASFSQGLDAAGSNAPDCTRAKTVATVVDQGSGGIFLFEQSIGAKK